MSVANILVQEDYIKTAGRTPGEVQKEDQLQPPNQV